jgi:hypothetical protein
MTQPASFDFPIRKAEYLFNHTTAPGEGGDKQKYWQEILGFQAAEDIRETILAEITLESLQPQAPNAHGDRYEAIITITGQSGKVRLVRTIWIVLFGEDVARFVTAVPQRRQPQ